MHRIPESSALSQKGRGFEWIQVRCHPRGNPHSRLFGPALPAVIRTEHWHRSAILRKYLSDFLRRRHLKLFEGAIPRLFVRTPSAELGHVAEAATLQMLIGYFGDKFRAQRLP